MAWHVELTDSAANQLRKIDLQVAKRILTFLRDRVATLEDPRSIGEALRGKELVDFWKYRVGGWQVIAEIDDDICLITVIRLGNRREIYRRQGVPLTKEPQEPLDHHRIGDIDKER